MPRLAELGWSLRVSCLLAALALPAAAPSQTSGNPILPGWYADPEAHVFDGQYWIFPTYSAPYDQQTFLDAFSSRDLITWAKHPRVLDVANVSWAKRAVWAPSIVEKDGWYYLFFGANDIQNDQQVGGIGVARSRTPEGPFTDYLGKPLIDRFHNGAQPIDQMVFKDRDGSYYIVYGGWRHCNIAKLNADFTGFVPLPDGSTFKEITPAGYVRTAPKPLVYYTDVLTSGLVINNNDFDNRKVGKPVLPVVVQPPHNQDNGDNHGKKGSDNGHKK